jgi:hypothetical protein
MALSGDSGSVVLGGGESGRDFLGMIVSLFVEGQGQLGEEEITTSVALMVPSTTFLRQIACNRS